MSQQIQITGGAKVRNLEGVLTGTSGVVNALAINVPNGIPQLDGSGKILVSQLPNSVMEYKGTWDASTNTPTLVNGTGNQGDVYLCNVAGTTNFGAGPITFAVGDSAIYSGTIWQRAGGATGTVTSVGLTSIGNDAITITGSPITTSGNINLGFAGTNLQYINGAGDLTNFPTLITSIGLSMPSAFNVSNSPLTANGTIGVTGAGYPSQYIRGDGTLADFPTSGGGGSSVSYYLNGGTSQGVIGGITYYEMSKIAVIGTGVDFPKTGDGLIVSFLTDAGDPAQLNIPAGNWNYEIYASMSSNGGTPQLYAELYVYDGTTFTLISTSSNEILYDGVNLNLYTFAMAVPATTLSLTGRLAVKLYATNSGGKTTTVHTQDGHLCQIITTFSTGITALNGLTAQVQYFATGTSGTDFAISSSVATHTFNLPVASAANTGKLSSTDWSTFNGKVPYTGATANVDLGTNYLTAFGVSTKAIELTGNGTQGGYLYIKQGILPFGSLLGSNAITADANKFVLVSNVDGVNIKLASLDLGSLTTNTARTYTLPDASGTVALTSNLSSYVPYTGATQAVNLGTNSFAAGSSITINGVGTTGGPLVFKQLTATSTNGGPSTTGISALGTQLIISYSDSSSNYRNIVFDTNLIANNSNLIYSYPNASGTIALTSDLGSYLPLTGGTLTGALGGTSAIFSSNLAVFCTPYSTSEYSLEVNGGLLVKNTGRTASLTIINANPSAGGNDGFVQVKTGGTTTAAYSTIQTYYGASNVAGSLQLQPLGGNVLIGTTTNSSYNLDVSGNARITTSAYFATASGKVGIGTTSATYTLSFNGDVATTIGMNQGTLGSQVPLTLKGSDSPTGTNNEGGPIYISSGLGTGNATTSNIIFSTAPSAGGGTTRQTLAERMRITSGGNVGIGNSGYSFVRLNIQAQDTTSSNYAINCDNSSVQTLFFVRNDGYINTGLRGGSPYNLPTTGRSAVIESNGGLGYLSSTRESKGNIKPIENVDYINQLNPVQFNYRKKDYNTNTFTDELYDNTTYGFIADEVEKVNKELAFYNEDGTLAGVEYNSIIAILTKAIQEMNTKSEEQQALITSLQERLDNAGL
jgi:hypothetical protein